MKVDLSFDEYGLLLQSVEARRQQVAACEKATFERLLEKLFQACNTVPVPPDNRDDETDPTSDIKRGTRVFIDLWTPALGRRLSPRSANRNQQGEKR
jgi:hypothetical protein